MYTFKGIPYAKAKRFHAPEPVEPWEGVFQATSYGYVCPLMDLGKPGGELMVPHRFWVMNEDCQNLNVWSPGLDGEKRPVMVWLHGGGFFAGSSIEQIAYEGENMCKLGQVVVVSVNHRRQIHQNLFARLGRLRPVSFRGGVRKLRQRGHGRPGGRPEMDP